MITISIVNYKGFSRMEWIGMSELLSLSLLLLKITFHFHTTAIEKVFVDFSWRHHFLIMVHFLVGSSFIVLPRWCLVPRACERRKVQCAVGKHKEQLVRFTAYKVNCFCVTTIVLCIVFAVARKYCRPQYWNNTYYYWKRIWNKHKQLDQLIFWLRKRK